MPDPKPHNNSPSGQGDNTIWRCTVCGFVFTGEKPSKGCPVCHSPSPEFLRDVPRAQLAYDGAPFAVLLINGSTHREFFASDELIVRQAKGVTSNVIALVQEGLEEKLKGRLVPVTE